MRIGSSDTRPIVSSACPLSPARSIDHEALQRRAASAESLATLTRWAPVTKRSSIRV